VSVCLSLSKCASVLDLSVMMPTPTVAVPQYVTVFCINSQHAQHRVAVCGCIPPCAVQ